MICFLAGYIPTEVQTAPVASTVHLKFSFQFSESEFTAIWTFQGNNIVLHKSDKSEAKSSKYISQIERERKNIVLRINNVTYEDAGSYKCGVYFSTSGGTIISSWFLQIQGILELHFKLNERH